MINILILSLLFLVSCNGDLLGSNVSTPPTHEEEQSAMSAAEECEGADIITLPTYTYPDAIVCDNGTPCCDPNCRFIDPHNFEYQGQSCYIIATNTISVSIAPYWGCVSQKEKLSTESANAVAQQHGNFEDQFFTKCSVD